MAANSFGAHQVAIIGLAAHRVGVEGGRGCFLSGPGRIESLLINFARAYSPPSRRHDSVVMSKDMR